MVSYPKALLVDDVFRARQCASMGRRKFKGKRATTNYAVTYNSTVCTLVQKCHVGTYGNSQYAREDPLAPSIHTSVIV